MKSRTIFLPFTILMIAGCRIKPEKSIIAKKEKDTIIQLQIDTEQYSNLPYWTTSIDKFSEAYIDTFSVRSNKFRFVSPVATHQHGVNSVMLQKLINGKWTKTALALKDNNYGGNFSYAQDINGDGYNDIVNEIRFTGVVYFYNPKLKSFNDTPAIEEVNPDWFLLDKAKNIYCDFQEFKGMCNDIHSKLYTYHAFQRIDLYDLNLYNCNEDYLITKLILSKCINGSNDSTKVIEETKLDQPIDTQEYNDNGKYSNGTDKYFDYKKYWLSKYKKLLGN